MADKREFLVVIDGKESVSPAAGKASDSLGKLGDQAKDTEKDFTGLDRKMREHADTITHLRQEIAKTGDVKLFGELGKQERAFGKLDGLKKSLSKAAGDAAPDMAVSLSGRLGPLLARLPVSGPMGVGLAVAAAAAAAPVGAVIAGAITGGVGIGGVIGGFAIAKNDPRVKAATSSLAAQIGSQLEAAAQPLVPAIVAAVDDSADELSKLQGKMRSIFTDSAGNIEPLAKGAVDGLSKIVSGFEKLNQSAGPTLREIGEGLSDFGGELGRVFSSLSDNGGEAADAIHHIFSVINGGVRVVGGVVNGLTQMYGWMRKIQMLRDGDTEGIVRWTAAQIASHKANGQAVGSLEGVGAAIAGVTSGVTAYTDALRGNVDRALTAAEANLTYRESLVRTKEAVDDKKRVSLEEERALLGLIRSTNDATVATDTSGATAEEAARKFSTSRDKIIALAIEMGYGKDAAKALADKLLKIPNVKPTVTVNTKSANAALNAFVTKMNRIDGSVVTTYVATRPLPGGGGGYRASSSQGGGRSIEPKASGGPVRAGEIYKVGEQGPEYMVAPRNGYVINNRDSAMLAAGAGSPMGIGGGGGGGAQTLVIRLEWPNGQVAAEIVHNGFKAPGRRAMSGLLGAIKDQGGDSSVLEGGYGSRLLRRGY